MLSTPKEPTDRDLRWFGGLGMLFLWSVVAWLILRHGLDGWSIGLLVVGLLSGLIGVFQPRLSAIRLRRLDVGRPSRRLAGGLPAAGSRLLRRVDAGRLELKVDRTRSARAATRPDRDNLLAAPHPPTAGLRLLPSVLISTENSTQTTSMNQTAADSSPDNASDHDDFARQAAGPSRNAAVELAADFVQFLKEEKKWWLIPILLSLGLIAVVALLLNSPAAPFIYPLF